MTKKRALLALLAAWTTLMGAIIFAVSSPAQAAPVRIMPLGDSITGSPGCWRALLWNRLQTNGFTNIDFVGTLPPQGCAVAHDGDNEGHGGILATNMANQNQLPPWLAATRPDIVIMHLGTNDVWSNIAPATILTAFSTLVDQMRASNPSMKILVAKIIPMNPSNCSECGQRVVNFNNAIPAWAAGKTTAASPITVVDQWTGFNTATDTFDGVHPTDPGNQKISDKWYPPLSSLLSGTTDTTPPTTPSGLTASGITSTSANLSWAASTDNVGVSGYDVLRAPGATGGTFAVVGTSTGTTFAATGLSAGTTYRFQVRARDAAGNVSGVSNTVQITTQQQTGDTTPPTAPSNLTASGVTSTSANLTWSASTDNVGVTQYQIWCRTGGGAFLQVGTSTTTSFTRTGLTPNTVYECYIVARDAAGNSSAQSTHFTFTTPGGNTGACSAVPTVQSQWGTGYVIQPMTITNTSTSTITSWTVTFTLPAGHSLTGSWNATVTTSGQTVTAKSVSHNGTLAPGASTTSFGFQGSRPNGNTALPSGYTCTTP